MSSHEAVPRLNTALSGRYRVEREVGEGGMATVYLAKDLKHNRNVALKVLKPELAAVVGAERFLAEIETTANLQHPHILPLFDSGEADSFLFYVMPFGEGETLRERIDGEKQLPVDDAVRIATNMAEALDYAHRQGVIHRDIKPANVLLQDGKPVISDFGIALAVGAAGGGRLTETGLSLGTPHYMSPEQATGGQNVGPATDIYALGCVLYELLVGDPPYTGSTAQAILGKIIAGELATATKQRASVPVNVDAAIRKALEKLPADRFRGASEFQEALADPGFRHGEEVGAVGTAPPGRWNPVTVTFATLFGVTALALAWSLLTPTSDPFPVARFEVPLGGAPRYQGAGVDMTFSPDGSRLVYVLESPDGSTQLWQRTLENLEPVPIPGTENGIDPVFSPDGSSVAFMAENVQDLKRVSLAGGPTLTVVSGEVINPTWASDGTIYFERDRTIHRVPSTGGEPTVVTSPIEGTNQWFADALPDGQGLLVALYDGGPVRVAVVGPNGGEPREILQGKNAVYAASGHVVYGTADGTLMAAPFDPSRLEVTGPSVPIVEGVANRGATQFALSETGTLAYRPREDGFSEGDRRLVIVDLEGNEEVLALGPRASQAVSWSPDGESVVYSSGAQIYTYNVVLNTTPRQLTFEGINQTPVFSPDGTRIAFSSWRNGTDGDDLFVKDLGDDSPPRSIITLAANQRVTQWPSDSLIVFERGQAGSRDLWTVDISDPNNPVAEDYLTSEADLRHMVLSPDGTLAAYRSSESGRNEISIRSFPEPGAPTIVSQGGGDVPFWSPDGGTLYYWNGAAQPWMVARIQR
ncbi:MAG TPA: protein kinase, partial [Longimicrobiales bacterium]|nr:protein kinase [Longimicrobiales bacterium]